MVIQTCMCFLEVQQRQQYIVAIFWSILLGNMQALLGDGFILMQDNARARIAQVSMTFIDYTDISVKNWPARYPDFNQTEHAWGVLFRRIRQWPQHPENVQNLIDALVQELQTIITKGHQEYATSLSACVNDMGGHTTSYW